jgi:hypothetical protein
MALSVSAGSRVQPRMGCAHVLTFILGAAAIGLLLLAGQGHRRLGTYATPAVLVPGLAGLGLGGLTLLYHRWARKLVAEAEAEKARRAQFPGQPWKWKKEWVGAAIEADAGSRAAGFWVFTILWNAISTPAVWALLWHPPAEKGAYAILLFPLVGLALLWAAVYQTLRWRKYGRACFVPSVLPGAIGGYLGGVIEVPARVLPEADARLVLRCIHREVRGSGKNRSTREKVLWEHEESIARDKWVSGPGGTRIPVLFYIPPECRATDDTDPDNEVLWRLAASAATPGVDFAAQFTVPVFATGETAAPPEPGVPVLEEYSAGPLDAAALAACGVHREGDTFRFSARHLRGMRIVTALLTLGFAALLVWFYRSGVPGPVWAVTLFFGVLCALFAGSVWFSDHELRIGAADVTVTKPRPWGTKVTRVPRGEVTRIRTDQSMASGDRQYFRLSLVGPEGAAAGGEPFLVRKLRHQFEELDRQGKLTPEKRRELEGEIAALRVRAKFIVPFARHIPGQTKAEAIAALVLQVIRGK